MHVHRIVYKGSDFSRTAEAKKNSLRTNRVGIDPGVAARTSSTGTGRTGVFVR